MVSSLAGGRVLQPDLFHEPQVRIRKLANPPRRVMPYDMEPGYYESGGIWLYGNVRLLQAPLRFTPAAFGPNIHSAKCLNEIEAHAERIVLSGAVLLCGIHNEAHRRASVVPLRWGAPRIIVFSGGFHFHLGQDLRDEPFQTARLWRYQWDCHTDLAVSRRAPDKLPSYATHNPTVDRMIGLMALGLWPGLRSDGDPFCNLLAASR